MGQVLTILARTLSTPSPGRQVQQTLSPYHLLFSNTLNGIEREAVMDLTATDYRMTCNSRVTGSLLVVWTHIHS
jgi:hypothetical protein